jgi:predicted  nucleic acid-binding Zn-ribbon protein
VCGAVYEEIKDLEDGCKVCGGRRFYFANKPLSDEERNEISQRKPSGMAKIMMDEARADKWFEAEVEEERRERRGIIEIKGKGSYEIDIEALLAEKPIVVEKDGSYLIYLPSLFDTLKRKR